MGTLPNGYGDYITRSKYVRNVGHALFVGAGGENWIVRSLDSSTTNVAFRIDVSNIYTGNGSSPDFILSDRFPQLISSVIRTGASEGISNYAYWASASIIVVSIAKTRLASPYGVTEFKSWLASNNLYVTFMRESATEHTLTTFPTRITAVATDYASITGALNPLTACELNDRYSAYTDLSTLGENRSLPDGQKDRFLTEVDSVADSGTFNVRITGIARVTEKIDLPDEAVTDGWEAGTVGATYSEFMLYLPTFGSGTFVFPAFSELANAYTSSVYPLSTYNDLDPDTPTFAGISIGADGYLYLVLPNTTADSLAELYTYLAANPLSVVIERTATTETVSAVYVQQSDLDMTVAVQSSTLSKESDFAVTYCRDLTHIIDGLLA
jgi:hypothetical protein